MLNVPPESAIRSEAALNIVYLDLRQKLGMCTLELRVWMVVGESAGYINQPLGYLMAGDDREGRGRHSDDEADGCLHKLRDEIVAERPVEG